jgi:Fe2+ transport system protein FeoA
MFKNQYVEKMYEMGFLDGSGVPVLYIGRMVPKG